MFDVIGGDIQRRSAGVIRAGGTLVTIAGPPEARPADGLAIDFVVVPDRAQLGEIVRRVRDGRLRTNIGNIATLDDAVAALNPTERRSGEDDHPRSSVRTRSPMSNTSGLWPGKVVTEVTPAGPFWEAEPEHQDYLLLPHGYTCHFPRPGWVLPRRGDVASRPSSQLT